MGRVVRGFRGVDRAVMACRDLVLRTTQYTVVYLKHLIGYHQLVNFPVSIA